MDQNLFHSDEFVNCVTLMLLKASPLIHITTDLYIYKKMNGVCMNMCVSAQGNSLQDFYSMDHTIIYDDSAPPVL